jgi:ABC-type multidrug transport system ATPase subunit
MSNEPMIEVEGLTRRFGAVTAVAGLDLTVRRGELVGLVGPDGAGKTTTLRLLVGALRPDAGTIRVAGRPIPAALEEVRRHLGYVAQRFSLYGDLTVDRTGADRRTLRRAAPVAGERADRLLARPPDRRAPPPGAVPLRRHEAEVGAGLRAGPRAGAAGP